ncbi:hypothetical protein THIOKS12210028 [Thiocapsa sp. KS1]|nr:hypothetical protein THIOKS12210028 [Thiocapsa sp. KS1]
MLAVFTCSGQNDLHGLGRPQQLVGAAVEDDVEIIDGAFELHTHRLDAEAVDAPFAHGAVDLDLCRLTGLEAPQGAGGHQSAGQHLIVRRDHDQRLLLDGLVDHRSVPDLARDHDPVEGGAQLGVLECDLAGGLGRLRGLFFGRRGELVELGVLELLDGDQAAIEQLLTAHEIPPCLLHLDPRPGNPRLGFEQLGLRLALIHPQQKVAFGDMLTRADEDLVDHAVFEHAHLDLVHPFEPAFQLLGSRQVRGESQQAERDQPSESLHRSRSPSSVRGRPARASSSAHTSARQ